MGTFAPWSWAHGAGHGDRGPGVWGRGTGAGLGRVDSMIFRGRSMVGRGWLETERTGGGASEG